MSSKQPRHLMPKYHGRHWIRQVLPSTARPWRPGKIQSADQRSDGRGPFAEALRRAVSHRPWRWPRRRIIFLADPHADADAFTASLVASGGVCKTGPGIVDFKLTRQGRKAIFIIGGDCLDKGPSNLDLLRSIRKLMDTGARVKLLAGNHDMRLLMGITALSLERDPSTEHLFIRMGPKVVPLLKEVHAQYLQGDKSLRNIPNKRECRRRMYPSSRWFREFPRQAAWLMSSRAIQRELTRMRRKVDHFEPACREAGLSLRAVYATALKCQELFLHPKGEFSWFYRHMQLSYRSGSFLFIHAGLDDRVTRLIQEKGTAHLNQLFREQIQQDLFEFYYGPLANTMRTKYREVDMPLSHHGVERAYRQGIHAVVHGHRNRSHGQLLMLRQGMLHIECDISMDRNTRRKEGLAGYGAGATIIDPRGWVLGISTDYPHAKLFEPLSYLSPK